MRYSVRSSFVAGVVISTLSLVGCGPSDRPADLPALYPVTLTLTQAGAPLEGASVQLIAQNANNSRWACGGSSDAEGKVIVRTLNKFDGAPPGRYKITVYKSVTEDTTPGVEDSPSSTKVYKTYRLVDPKYQLVENSPTEINVDSGDNVVPPIDLGPAVRILEKNL